MLISCLTVTQPSRFELFEKAVDCFRRQSWPDKQLIVVVDGDDDYRQQLDAFCRQQDIDVKVLLGKGPTLGEKRNESVAAADGDLLCCWDDDDQYHSDRLAIQAKQLLSSDADFCYLSGHLHYLADVGDLSWVDWRRDGNGDFLPDLPNFRSVGGSIMAHASRMLPYPAHNRGEDAMFASFAVLRKVPILLLEGYGWCYLRCFHGDNTTSRHHQETVNRQTRRRLDLDEIEQVIHRMRDEYDPEFSLAQVLDEYSFHHSPIMVEGRPSHAD